MTAAVLLPAASATAVENAVATAVIGSNKSAKFRKGKLMKPGRK